MNGAGDEISSIVNIEIQVIQNLTISRYLAVAGLVILLYDTVLTIEAEVSGFLTHPSCAHSPQIRLVWPGPFKIPKLLYYINRYWAIASLIATNYCGQQGIRANFKTLTPLQYSLVSDHHFQPLCVLLASSRSAMGHHSNVCPQLSVCYYTTLQLSLNKELVVKSGSLQAQSPK